MGRKVRRGRTPLVLQTTDDLRGTPRRLWTEADVDTFVGKLGLELQPWQRDVLVQWGGRGRLGVDSTTRSSGKMHAYRLTRELAIAMGHKVTDTPNGFTIELKE